MKDVAAVAGVSLSTVSRVVSGNPLVDPVLAVQVARAVDVLGYRHNHTAGTLRRANGLSATIGLIFEDVSNPFFSAIHRGVEDVARTRSVVTFAGSSDEDPDREHELVEAVLDRRVDGLIIAPTAERHAYLQRDIAAGTAVVFVDRPPASIAADSVLSDNHGGAERAVSHLIAHGHHRIAFIGSPPFRYTAIERLAGYRSALSRAGIVEDRELVRHSEEPGEGYDIALELLDAPSPPTALFTSQNLITVDVLRALHRRKRQHDIALVGFDDIELAGSIEPAISVIEQDARGIGRTAAELLFSRLDGYTGPPRRVELPTPLIARGTGEIAP